MLEFFVCLVSLVAALSYPCYCKKIYFLHVNYNAQYCLSCSPFKLMIFQAINQNYQRQSQIALIPEVGRSGAEGHFFILFLEERAKSFFIDASWDQQSAQNCCYQQISCQLPILLLVAEAWLSNFPFLSSLGVLEWYFFGFIFFFCNHFYCFVCCFTWCLLISHQDNLLGLQPIFQLYLSLWGQVSSVQFLEYCAIFDYPYLYLFFRIFGLVCWWAQGLNSCWQWEYEYHHGYQEGQSEEEQAMESPNLNIIQVWVWWSETQPGHWTGTGGNLF